MLSRIKCSQVYFVCIWCIIVFSVSAPAFRAEAQNSWHYPLEITAGVSSTFGEFRGNRLHTGVDLRTNMQTGYKVYAIDDGTISRLSVKKSGFGNALYISHPNGLMSVYGHLDRFEEQALGLRSVVKKYQQRRNKKYPGDIYLEVPVKRGQLIGYSGETGYGLPHLHFEVRQGGATPIDPFKHGFSYKDQMPPIIESLLIQPLGSQSYIDGEHFQREYRAEQRNGVYYIPQIPRIHGNVRLTVSAYDQIGAGNKCAVDRIDLYIASSAINKLEMFIDQHKFFSNQFNLITYTTKNQTGTYRRGGLVYDYNLTRLSNPTQYYYRLYTISKKLFPFREVFVVNNGIWDTSAAQEGRHTIAVEAFDPNGNRSVVQMQVDVEHQPSLNLAYPVPETGWRAELRDFHDFFEIICQTAEPLLEAPIVRIVHQVKKTEQTRSQESSLTSRGSHYYSGTYNLTPNQDGHLTVTLNATTQTGKLLEQTWGFPVKPIVATQGGTVKYEDKASMSFPAGALYEDIFANIFPTAYYEETDGLPVIGDVYDFRPAGVPLEKEGTIRIRYPEGVKDLQKLGIFWWDNIKKRWYFMDDQQESKTRYLKAAIIYPSIYAILQDTVHPVISELVPEHGSVVSTTQSALEASIKDTGKGIDESSIIMTLDGEQMDGEYDPDRDRYKYPLTRKLAPGTHTLTVQANDKAGNPAKTRTSKFTVK